MTDRIETTIPGRAPIELVSFYEEFRDYYPLCELETKQWFVDHVRPDWWIFDIGANVGYYTILFSQLAPKGRVFAFEPTRTAAMLRANLEHNKVENAEVHEIALGLTTGSREDRIYRLWGTEGEVQTYPFYRLDDFIDQHAIQRVDCLKIDVDSFDFEVLRGAERTLLEHSPTIVVELNHALQRRQQSVAQALSWLAAHGYRRALVLDRYDNFVLQRGPEALAGQTVATSVELLFPPPLRIDERTPSSAVEPVATSFIASAWLDNGAVAERLSSSFPQHLVGKRRVSAPAAMDFDEIAAMSIETTGVQWDYALVLSVQPAMDDGLLTIEVGVEVAEGMLGIAIAGEDISRISRPERVLVAMTGRQYVVFKVPTRNVRSVIFRNVAPDDARTRFTVVSVQARRKVV
jgi:FkbM family methyltransferase